MPSLRRWVLPLLCLSLSDVAVGARFPDAIERQFELHDRAARTAAAWFGLDTESESALSLRLGRGEAWAIYLLKQDTPERLWNDSNGSPPRFNDIVYKPSPSPTLAVGPFWLDLGTRAPQPMPGLHTFSSGYLAPALEGDEAWLVLARRLRADPEWRESESPQLLRCVTDAGAELCLEMHRAHDYENNVDGHIVVVTAKAR